MIMWVLIPRAIGVRDGSATFHTLVGSPTRRPITAEIRHLNFWLWFLRVVETASGVVSVLALHTGMRTPSPMNAT